MKALTKILNVKTEMLKQAMAKIGAFPGGRLCHGYMQIIEILYQYGNLNNSYLYQSLLHADYDPLSKMAYMLAVQGGRGFKYVVRLYHEKRERAKAINVARNILLRQDIHKLKYTLTKKQTQILKAIVRSR